MTTIKQADLIESVSAVMHLISKVFALSMRKQLVIAVLIASVVSTGMAANEKIRLGPFEDKPPKKTGTPERVRGKIESGPFGGKAFYLETPDRRQYIIGYSRLLSQEADSTLEKLSQDGAVVDLDAHVIKNCSKAQEAEGKIVGCNWLDLSRPFYIQAVNNDAESTLLEALRLRNADADNVKFTKRALKEYARTGSIGTKADTRSDYSDYYFAKKPAFFMGHRLFMIRSEYMDTYIGCCVRPAVEVVVLLESRGENLRDYAVRNACEIRREINMKETWERLGSLTIRPPSGTFAVLTCQTSTGEGSTSIMHPQR